MCGVEGRNPPRLRHISAPPPKEACDSSLRAAQRRSNPELDAPALDCFASLAMTDWPMARDLPSPHPQDKAAAIALLGDSVSRETWERLEQFVDLLLSRQRSTNLVASSTIPQLWTRHVADSLQLIALAPNARRWIDLGTGGGFPGMVIACAFAGKPGAEVHLVESTQ